MKSYEETIPVNFCTSVIVKGFLVLVVIKES